MKNKWRFDGKKEQERKLWQFWKKITNAEKGDEIEES